MAFDVRCPACKAKLRFDDPPKKGEEIECGKCGEAFPAPSAAAWEEKKPKEGAEEKPRGEEKKPKPRKTVEAVPRTFFSEWLLLLIVGGCMLVVVTTLTVIYIVVARAAKAEDMLACIPDNFNVIRGANVKGMRNYSGAKKELDKFYDGEAYGIFEAACTELGIDKDADLAYYVCAREAGAKGALFLFATRNEFSPSKLGDGEPVKLKVGNENLQVVCPNRWLIAVSKGSNNDAALLKTVAENARRKPKDGMQDKVGNTGRLAIRGQLWSIFRPTGKLQDWLKAAAESFKEDASLGKLREGLAQATTLATWASFGSGGVRLGVGIEVADSATSAALVQDMKKGPLGKSDESEPPNGFKKAMSTISNVSTNGQYYQYLEYKQQRECAYAITRISELEKATNPMNEYINPGRAAGSAQFSNQGGPPMMGPGPK